MAAMPQLKPQSGFARGAKRPTRTLGGPGSVSVVPQLGGHSLAERGAALIASEAPVRGAANITGSSSEATGAALASARQTQQPVKVEELPPPSSFKQAEGYFAYDLEFMKKIAPLYTEPPCADFQQKIAFLLEEGVQARARSRPFGFMGSQVKQAAPGQKATPDAAEEVQGQRTGFDAMVGRDMFGSAEPTAAPEPLLQTSENAFTQRKKETDEISRFGNIINGLLNKLTPEKYDNVSRNILEENVLGSDDHMDKVIELLFKQAVDQPIYVSMYARLAKDITVREKDLAEGGQQGGSKFRRHLIMAVQAEYENRAQEVKAATEGVAEAEKMEKGEEDRDKKIADCKAKAEKARKRWVGNIKFLGELFLQALITEKVARAILCDLLYGWKMEGDDFYPDDHKLELLLEFILVIGPKLDGPDQPQGQKFTNEHYMRKLQRLITTQLDGKPRYPPRLRFKIQDMLDVRKKGWKVQTKQAQTIKEFEEAQEEKARKKELNIKDASYSGDSTAWGKTAGIDAGFQDLHGVSEGGKKGKKKKDEGWQQQQGQGGKKKDQGHHQHAKKGPQATAGAYGAIQVSGGKPKEKSDDKKAKEAAAKAKAAKEEAKKQEERDREAKAKRKAEKAEAEKAADRVCEVPEGFFEKCKGRFYEWRDAQDTMGAPETLAEEWGELEPRPLIVHQLAKVSIAEKDEETRTAIRELITLLNANKIINDGDITRGLGWFVSSAICDQYEDDFPQVWPRLLALIRGLLPPASYGGCSRVFRVGLRAVKATLEETEQMEYMDESVETVMMQLWDKVHLDFKDSQIPTAAWQDQVLPELLGMNDRTGWLKTQTEDGSVVDLIERQCRFLLSSDLVSAERFLEWRAALEAAEDKKAKAALEKLEGFFSSLA
eukprot:TRINITY_DN812_c0_g1_i2.p1 TRINITY_DN812_c0_g1~~TRINITY_DN812_c0_g1_i2.p1  ORF type:complete len:923 (+),score=385.49 TRINITY_DN812_c0_g1_i2:108-2771(+)